MGLMVVQLPAPDLSQLEFSITGRLGRAGGGEWRGVVEGVHAPQTAGGLRAGLCCGSASAGTKELVVLAGLGIILRTWGAAAAAAAKRMHSLFIDGCCRH
jgi:hypothetical protein